MVSAGHLVSGEVNAEGHLDNYRITWPHETMRAGGGWMDPVTIGAVLLAIVGGAGSQLGTQLWDGLVSVIRRPFHRKGAANGDGATVVPAGEVELAALQQAPGDERRAVALAEVLLARSGADDEFGRALESWWQQAEPIRAGLNIGDVTNTISGGSQQGPVLQGRDFNITFGGPPASPPSAPPS